MCRLINRSAKGRAAGALAGLIFAGCASSADLCTMSTSSLDPLASVVDPNPEASAKLRTFYAAARGIRDAAGQAEEMTRLACVAIGTDLGLHYSQLPAVTGAPYGQQDAATVCGEAAARVKEVLRDAPRSLAFSWTEPSCNADEALRGRCEALCATAAGQGVDPYCRTTCASQASVYANCSAATVTANLQAAGHEARSLLIMGETMRRNLPWLIHAQQSMFSRLEADLETLLKTGKDLPRLVPEAGPQGLACLHAAIGLVQEARTDFERAASGVAAVLNGVPRDTAGRREPTNPGEGAS